MSLVLFIFWMFEEVSPNSCVCVCVCVCVLWGIWVQDVCVMRGGSISFLYLSLPLPIIPQDWKESLLSLSPCHVPHLPQRELCSFPDTLRTGSWFTEEDKRTLKVIAYVYWILIMFQTLSNYFNLLQSLLSKRNTRDFPGGPVAKTRHSNAGDLDSILGQRTRSHMPQLTVCMPLLKIPYAAMKIEDPAWPN